jgi:hypothetical protein
MKKLLFLFLILFSCQPDPVDRATGTDFPYPVRANGGLAITPPLSIGAVNITATGAEINFLSGVTSAIQTQLNLKANTTALSGYVPTSRTVNGYALTSNVSITATDLSLGNVTNESKATMFTSPTLTGTPLAPTAAAGTSTTQIATTAFVNTSGGLTYYVSNTGSDVATGLTPTTAWQTISKINSSTFNPGDIIKFEAGGIWRETLTISSSGTANKYITFGTYGTGTEPKIYGSTEVTTWILSHGNVWYSYSAPYIDPASLSYYGNIFYKELRGNITWGRVKKAAWVNLAVEYDWAWTLDTLYIYSPTDPNTRYLGVEMAQRNECIDLNKKNYLTVDGVEIAYSGRYGIKCGDPNYSELSGLIIKNCNIHHFGSKDGAGGYALSLWYSDMLIQNNIIHDASRRNISLYLSTQVINPHDIIIENNTMYDGFHTSSVDINTAAAGTWDNIMIRNNLIYQNTNAIDATENPEATGMFIAVQGILTGAITNVYVYNNIFKTPNQWSLMLEHANSVYVYNNTFYGTNPLIADNRGFITMSLAGNHVIKNNIFYNNMAWSDAQYFRCINAPNTVTSCVIDYNLYYTTDASQSMVTWQATTYTTAQWAAYKAATSQDANSPTPADPLFISLTNYNLGTGSTAIDAGFNTGFNYDYVGNRRLGNYDIGVFEVQ